MQTLIFDLGNVILNLKPDKDWFEEDLCTTFYADKLQQLQQSSFFEKFEKFETGKITTTYFIEQLKEIALDKNISDNEIIAVWNQQLQDIPPHRITLLNELKQKYRLLLLSNTNEIHYNFIQQYIQNHFGENCFNNIFEYQFYSHQVGLRKPNKEIYEFVLSTGNIEAKDAIFFDDKIENLIEPNKLGIQIILVDKDIVELTTHLI